MNLIQKAIRSYREKQGASFADLERSLGIAKAQIFEIENGRASPSLRSIQIFAKFFGLTDAEVGAYILSLKPEAPGPKRKRITKVVRKISRTRLSYILRAA